MTLAPWPLTGRTEQLEAIGRDYRAGTVGGVVLHGPAGVGKTRLAEEALARAERSGRPTARAVGHPSMASIPLGALAHLLPASLVGGLGVGDDERTGLFHGARAELRRMAGDDRLLLLVDDLDLLDDTSLGVLVPLVVSRTAFLIGTVRTGRTASPRLTGLQRDGHLTRLDLRPLGVDELGALLHRALDHPVSTTALDEFARLSGGNLQVLTELVRGATERGSLVHDRGTWQLIGDLPTTVALDELVDEHLAGVDEAGLAVLELLAICERFGLADLERRHGLTTLERLEAGRLVSVVTTGRRTAVRLAHPLYGEVLRARLPPLRLRRIQQELADVVEGHGARRREDVVQVALWRIASGGRVVGDQLLRAARLALAGHDANLAIQLIEAWPDDDDTSPFARAEVLAEAHDMLGHHDAVERVVTATLARELTDAQRGTLGRRLATTRFSSRRDLDGALAALDEAQQTVRDPDELGALQARRAMLLADAGRPADALEVLDSIVVPSDTRAQIELASARAVSLLSVGRHAEAAELARRSAASHAALPGSLARRGIAAHLVNEAHALAYSGQYAEARRLVEPATEQARAANAIGAWVWFEMVLAEIARDTGRAGEAIRRFTAAAGAAASSGQEAALVWAHVGVAQGHLLLGECGPAEEALARADAVGDSPVATSYTTRERTRAWLDAGRGDLVAARARLREVVEAVRSDGVRTFEAAVLHDLVRFGRAAETVERFQWLADVVDGPLVRVHAGHAVAVAEADADALQVVVDDYERLDILAYAAEAAAELAELRQQRGDGRGATAAMQRSAELATRAGGIRTPPLARGSGVEPLTAREREVALLAAGGRSSREIADTLYLSARTVETHLARAYRKLGISTRSELAAALGTGGAT
ncbi:MAG: LuxR C-terminal-related transcriptional regulator [Ilumatobacteraceae bacterium]